MKHGIKLDMPRCPGGTFLPGDGIANDKKRREKIADIVTVAISSMPFIEIIRATIPIEIRDRIWMKHPLSRRGL